MLGPTVWSPIRKRPPRFDNPAFPPLTSNYPPCISSKGCGGFMKFRSLPLFGTIFLLLAAVSSAQDLASFEKRVTVKTLPNGLTLLVCERPEAPVFSFFTHVDTGSTQEDVGKSGLAHMFGHMAFKGTATIGPTNYPAEKAALEKVETAYAAYDNE